MSAQIETKRSEINVRGHAILREKGGLDRLAREPESETTREAFELLVLNEAEDRAPLPQEFIDGPRDVDGAFVHRVVGKLRYTLRHLHELEMPTERKEAILLRSVVKECRRTVQERNGRYVVKELPAEDRTVLDTIPCKAPGPGRESRLQDASWWNRVKRRVPSRVGRVAAALAAFIEQPQGLDGLLRPDGRFDHEGIAKVLGCSERETRDVVLRWSREIKKVKPMIPRTLKPLYARLSRLASTPFDGLADAHLRQTVFDISRSLASGFGHINLHARGLRAIDGLGFQAVVDLLLEEWDVPDSNERNALLERLMRSTVEVRDALEQGDVDRAFANGAMFVLDAARIQHHTSPARMQILLSYACFLYTARQYDAFCETNQAVIDRCNAIVAKQGSDALDRAPEYENGDTLRRVRTYASLNQASCLFYHQYTTASKEHFIVHDYEQLVALSQRLDQLRVDDPQADLVLDEQLVLRASIWRAAHNRTRSAKRTDKPTWIDERERQKKELRCLIELNFMDPQKNRPDVHRLIDTVRRTAHGFAIERILDVLATVFRDDRSIVNGIETERNAHLRLCL